MKKYKVTYRSKTDGDCTSVWCHATSRANAEQQVRREYWDVADIICVQEM